MKELILKLFNQYDRLNIDNKILTIGFDGFVDNIFNVVKERDFKKEKIFFPDIKEFGDFIIDKSGKSFSMEIVKKYKKIGGNMPILSNALSILGAKVNCIGALGLPEINGVFHPLVENGCKIYSVAQPGYTAAMEFADGKIMLYDNKDINEMSWATIESKIGLNQLMGLYNDSDVIGLVNWSEVPNSNEIWHYLLDHVIKHISKRDRMVFMDLSDISGRKKDEIISLIKIIREYGKQYKTILSLNENEFELLFKITHGVLSEDRMTMCKIIYHSLDIDSLIVHFTKESIAVDKTGSSAVKTNYVDNPKLTTGGGDHFNAGLIAGILSGFDINISMVIAGAVSGFYIKEGYTPDKGDLYGYLKEWYKIL